MGEYTRITRVLVPPIQGDLFSNFFLSVYFKNGSTNFKTWCLEVKTWYLGVSRKHKEPFFLIFWKNIFLGLPPYNKIDQPQFSGKRRLRFLSNFAQCLFVK